MPDSLNTFDDAIVQYIKTQPKVDQLTVLDVGPGMGKYSRLLREAVQSIDAVEIFARYLTDYALHTKYDQVFVENIVNFDFEYYDVIVMGDILEHITVEEAVPTLNRLMSKSTLVVVVVPYTYPQGEWRGNIHEKHEQEDLTPAIMEERYPMLTQLFTDDQIGVYVTNRTIV